MTDEEEIRGLALVLLTREVLCEQIFRERLGYDSEHPARSLKVRGITPEEILCESRLNPADPLAYDGAASYLLSSDSKELKTIAAQTLDAILAKRTKETA